MHSKHLENLSARPKSLNMNVLFSFAAKRGKCGKLGRGRRRFWLLTREDSVGRGEGSGVKASDRKYSWNGLETGQLSCVLYGGSMRSYGTDLSLRPSAGGMREMRLPMAHWTAFVPKRLWIKGRFGCNWDPMLKATSTHTQTKTGHTHSSWHNALATNQLHIITGQM